MILRTTEQTVVTHTAVVQVQFMEVNYNHRLSYVDRCHLLKGQIMNIFSISYDL